MNVVHTEQVLVWDLYTFPDCHRLHGSEFNPQQSQNNANLLTNPREKVVVRGVRGIDQ